jgi:NAD(P)-dependent dehydrogenase (short-subunit alcohol dehydrogenase family)
MSMQGQVALVTGGGTGIGESVAKVFSALGAHVLVMGRRAEPVLRVAGAVNGTAVVGDASDSQKMKEVVSVAEKHGGLDAVVHCAGSFEGGAALEVSDDAWGRAIDINLTSAFITARESLPSLIKKRGSIVFVSSIAGLQAMPQGVGYVTAKHALIGLMRSLALDYGPQGVRVNAVCPGWVRTPMADGEMQPVMQREGITLDEAYALVNSDIPLKRTASPDEIADVCKFLVSKDASIITGAVITTDGGSTIVCPPTIRL